MLWAPPCRCLVQSRRNRRSRRFESATSSALDTAAGSLHDIVLLCCKLFTCTWGTEKHFLRFHMKLRITGNHDFEPQNGQVSSLRSVAYFVVLGAPSKRASDATAASAFGASCARVASRTYTASVFGVDSNGDCRCCSTRFWKGSTGGRDEVGLAAPRLREVLTKSPVSASRRLSEAFEYGAAVLERSGF